jgi:hypothetical protein
VRGTAAGDEKHGDEERVLASLAKPSIHAIDAIHGAITS